MAAKKEEPKEEETVLDSISISRTENGTIVSADFKAKKNKKGEYDYIPPKRYNGPADLIDTVMAMVEGEIEADVDESESKNGRPKIKLVDPKKFTK
jgi:hypothetical protein